MTARWFVLLFCVEAGTGVRPTEPQALPFYVREAGKPEPAASIGLLDIAAGRISWMEPVPGHGDNWPILNWKGQTLLASFEGQGKGKRKWTELRDTATGRLRLRLDGRVTSTVKFPGLTVLLVDEPDAFRGVDAATGRELWSHPGSSGTTILLRGRSPTLILHRTADHVAVDPLSGAELWKYPVLDGETFQEIAGRLWVYRRDSDVLREVDPANGRDLRSRRFDAPIERISQAAHRLLVTLPKRILMLRPEDLGQEWAWDAPAGLGYCWGNSSTIVVHLDRDRHALLDATSGSEVALLALPAHTGTSAFIGGSHVYSLQLTGQGAGTELIVTSTRTGKTLWQGRNAQTLTTHLPLLLLTKEGEIVRLDPLSGDTLWSTPLQSPILASWLGRGRVVLLTSRDAFALDPRSGRELWRVKLGDKIAKACFGWAAQD